MKQEDKELLLKDLCARQPYKVKIDNGGIGKTLESITIKPDYIEIVIKGTYAYSHFIHKGTGEWDSYDDLSRCKPYLRPMSSMTDAEKKEFHSLMNSVEERCINAYGKGGYTLAFTEVNDWLNANHFDYRGLIPMDLAIVAPKGMY